MYQILGVKPTEVYTTEVHALGQVAFDDDGKGYVFVRAKGISAVGDVMAIDEAYDADQVTTTVSAPGTGAGLTCGVALSVLADNEYGWVQVYGVCAAINGGTDCVAHTRINTTATVGQLDDDATSGAEIVEGISLTAVPTSNLAAGILSWPYIGATIA